MRLLGPGIFRKSIMGKAPSRVESSSLKGGEGGGGHSVSAEAKSRGIKAK